jgi:hypothetical protein
MQKNSINAEKFRKCRKIQLMQKKNSKMQKNSINSKKFIMQKNFINAEKCLNIPKMQKNSIKAEKFH